MKKTALLIALCCLLLTGCSVSKQLPPIDADRNYVVTVNIQDHSLSFIEMDSYKKATWTLPFPVQRALLLNADHLLLYGKDMEHAYVYELSTGKALNEWKIGKGIDNMVLSLDGSYIYAADQNRNALRVFTLDGKQQHEVALGTAPFTLLESSDKLYAASYEDHYMNVISKSSWQLDGTFQTPPRSVGGWIDEEKGELWLGGHGSGEHIQDDIYIYSLASGRLKEKLTVPVMPIDFVRTNSTVYTLSHGSNQLWKIDYETKKIQESIETGSNPFSMKLFQNKLYIASYDSNKIQVVDTNTLETIEQLPVGTGPFQLFIREGETT